jgi:VWFA-related protein
LVLVDAVASGKDGKPISGLTVKDFRVFEDGKEQKIAVFHEELTARRPEPPAPLPPNVYTNQPAYHPASGPLTVILLDSLNTPLFSQSRARMALIKYLAGLLKQGQPVAILSLTNHLTVLQDFTTSRHLLLAAAKKFAPGETRAMAVREEMTSRAKDNEYLNVLQMARACDNCAALVEFYQDLKAIDRHILTASDQQRAQLTAQALQNIANALAGYPGRKNLVWLSESFPSLYPGGPKLKLAWSVESQLHRAADLLNEARVAVYPVDARGLTTNVKPGPNEVQWAEISQGSQYESSPNHDLDWQRQVRSSMYNLFTSQQTMRSVAQATGGLAFFNSNDITHAIAAAAADSSDSYLIGYYPSDRNWNGKFRRITVKLARPGLRLRYRRGYYALPGFEGAETKPEKPAKERIQAALLDPLPATAVLFRVQAPPPGPKGQVKGRILLPGSSVTLGKSCDVNLSFRVAALTPAGKIAQERGNDLRRRLSDKQCSAVRKGGLVFHFALSLKPGSYQLEFLARDNHSGAVGRVDVPVQIKSQ